MSARNSAKSNKRKRFSRDISRYAARPVRTSI